MSQLAQHLKPTRSRTKKKQSLSAAQAVFLENRARQELTYLALYLKPKFGQIASCENVAKRADSRLVQSE